MRVISGKYRGLVLNEFDGKDIRPTSDRVKESLFNILMFGIAESRVLDLCCGTGSIGIECLSRGASFVHFNDVSADSIKLTQSNVKKLKGNHSICVTHSDCLNCLSSVHGKFDFIFIDPPYKLDLGQSALAIIAQRDLLTDDGIAVYERDLSFTQQIDGLQKYDERKYGKTYLTFFKKESNR